MNRNFSPVWSALAFVCAAASLGLDECSNVVVKDSCRYAGKHYAAGDHFPAQDGCNTCSCERDGSVSCTLVACVSTCQYDGKEYQPGDTFPASDGCNQCSCGADGSSGVACTEVACLPDAGTTTCTYQGKAYAPGDFVPADPCNTCVCGSEGAIACTARACLDDAGVVGCTIGDAVFPVGSQVLGLDGCNDCVCGSEGQANFGLNCSFIYCDPSLVRAVTTCSPITTNQIPVTPLYRDGDKLALQLPEDICVGHVFDLCTDGSFALSSPPQVQLWVTDTTPNAPCDPSASSPQRMFDLTPLRSAYAQGGHGNRGTISLQIYQGQSRLYTF